MEKKVNGHTADYIKRIAKSIKKNQNISHHEALELASKQNGFHSWKHFQNLLNKSDVPSLVYEMTEIKELTLKTKNPYRNLLIAGLNELLKQNKDLLQFDKNKKEDEGYIFVNLFGFQSVVIWREISFGEISLAVWWKYDHSRHPQANLTGNARENFRDTSPLASKTEYKKFVGVVVHGWVERATGKYIQGSGGDSIIRDYVRRGEKAELEKLPTVQPNGFQAEGLFFV
ncbi:MAG: hypothetical protein GXO46_15380 [Chlorobi bacterium]|mgnify:FL=1|uniref:hypothetical protein n=1 Tax=Sphingobacterium sp. 40-24 TaxID=1895843 RepID=UPI0009666372|nr:hypothetical protein [Sphingobacterium sp. 40-24]NPA10356.1 hypothetical protein [Chlorobiota bacterium]OJZ01191.1 MAG: hypothetical protein BGP15_03045 [Sphingobacterium sp. 40-24]